MGYIDLSRSVPRVVYGTSNLASAALSLSSDGTGAASTSPNLATVDFLLTSVILKFSAVAEGEIVTVTMDSGIGATYDTVLYTHTMDGVETSVTFVVAGFLLVTASDKIVVACTNSGTPASVVYASIYGLY